MVDLDDNFELGRIRRWAATVRTAEERGLLGSKDRRLEGRFSNTLVEEAKRASGITDDTDLVTYALIKVVLEDDFGERLLARKGSIPKQTLFGG